MSPIFTFPFHLHGVSFISIFFFFFPPPSFGGQFAVTPVQTGGPKPPRYFSSLFTFLSPCSPSLRSLSLSVLPGCLARGTVLDLLVLSALCIWTVLCARLGLRPDVRAGASAGASARIGVCFVSLREKVITLQFMNLKLTWRRLPKAASQVLTQLIPEKTFTQ